MSIELKPLPAVMSMTLEITRAATGITETVDLVLTPLAVESIESPIEGEAQCL